MDQHEAIVALGALGQATRLDIFRLLIRTGPDGMSAGEVGQAVATPPSTLSHHLGELAGAGLVTARRDGRQTLYAADLAGIGRLVAFITEDCCQGRPDLCGERFAVACAA